MKWKLLPLLLCTSLGALAGGEGPADAGDFRPDPRPLATTLVYDCNGFEFVTRLGPGEMALWLPDGRYSVLSQVRSASGTKYQEGDTIFWSKGEAAMLQLGDVEYFDCRILPERGPWADARRRGVAFRAIGNEPGWHLEIVPGRQLLYVGDYGAQRLVVPDPGERVEGTVHRYHAVTESAELWVEIDTAGACFDTMSGEAFPASVTLTVDGRSLSGCGRYLDTPPLTP